MGCASGFGRIILVVLNLAFLLVSLALIVGGVVLKFFANTLVSLLGDFGAVTDVTKLDLGIPEMADVKELPFLDDVGLFFIIFGCILFVISFCACCGACYQWRPLLIVFVILMAVLVIVQAVVGGLFLAKDSVLHDTIKNRLGDKIKNEYDPDPKTTNIFSFSINILNYLLDCCGISGWDDFKDGKPVGSCCKKETMADLNKAKSTCQSPTNDPINFYQQGCYTKLQDKVLAKQAMAAVILGLILFFQVVEIVFAVLIVKDVSSVGPV